MDSNMDSTQRMQRGASLILQLSPSVLGASFLTAIIFSIITKSLGKCEEKKPDKSLPRKQVICGTVLVILLNVTQSALIVTGIFTSKGPLASTDRNVYSLAQALVWTVTLVFFLNLSDPGLLAFGGFWTSELVVEIALFALTLEYHVPKISLEWAQCGLALLRSVTILFLLSILVQRLARSQQEKGSDEETAPLLVDTVEPSAEAQANGETTGYGSVASNGTASKPNTDSNESSDNPEEDEEEEWQKKEREDMEKMRNHIKEKGGWLNYAKDFRIFIALLWPNNRPALQLNMIATGLILLAIRALNVLVPRQLGIVVNALGEPDKSAPFRQLAIYILLNFLDSSAGLSTLRQFLWFPVELNATQTLKKQSFNHIMSLSCEFHDNKRSGELYQSMWQGESVIELLETIVFELTPMVVDLVIACAYFYYIFDAYMLLIVTTTMVSYFWATSYFTSMQTEVRRKFQRASRKCFQVMYDTMDQWKTVSYFNRLSHAQGRYAVGIKNEMKNKIVYWRLSYFTSAVQSFVLDIGLYAACFYAIYQVIYGGQTVGKFIVLLTYWGQLSSPMGYLSRIYRRIVSDLIDAERLLELLQTPITIADGPKEMQYTKGQVEFQNVDFFYDKEKEVLKDISFRVNPGQTVALVGTTGSGKSTILKLLFRFYDVKAGSIRIDDQDLRDVTVTSLRDLIGVVPQDSTLFNDTVLANVRYAKLDATEADVVEACKSAAIHDDIVEFPKGYHSQVGERGVKLSGGQLQRIAIARAILKNPKIILLDEATSAVDTETEGKIQAALEKLARDRTTFVVAHRLSTVNNADLILVVEKGKIIEQGSPAELMKSKGKYYSLWMKQLGLRNAPGETPGENTPVSGDEAAGEGGSGTLVDGESEAKGVEGTDAKDEGRSASGSPRSD